MATPDQFGSNYEKFATQVNFKDSNGKTHNLRIQVNFQPATGAAESSFPDIVVGPAVAKGETLSTSTQLGGFKTSYNNTTIDTFLLNRGVTVDPTTRQNFKVVLQNQTNRIRYNRVSAQYPQLKSGFSQANGSTLYIPGTQNSPATAPPAGTPGSQPPLAPDPGAPIAPTLPTAGGSSVTVQPFVPPEKSNVSDKNDVLKYPLEHADENKYDYIMIAPFQYIPSISTNNLGSFSVSSLADRTQNGVNRTGSYIYLPMVAGISETNNVGWGAEELNPIQARFGQAAFNTIQGFAGNPGGFAGALQKAGNELSQAVKDMITAAPELTPFISAYFAGQAVGANILGRTGIVINPNLELLFQGPKLRSFRYNFRFTPRSEKEAEVIRAIIKTFKKTMAPKRTADGIFLGVPDIYQIRYMYGNGSDEDHPFLNKIKPCALTAFNVNYTPDGSYMTYNPTENGGGGSMTSYTVDMQFDEIEPIYNDEIEINESTMGY